MSDTLLLTGGTGFLGMALIARLLEDEEGPDILVAVRAGDREHAARRVDELLARLYDTPPSAAQRLRAVPAEVTAPHLGLTPADRRAIRADVDRVVHCAASIEFTLPFAQARAINVGGTRAVLDLARELADVERVVHVSTAYVSGRAQGRFHETELALGQSFRNTYEQTKGEADRLVSAADDLPTVIVRPSIVVGESGSGWTSAFNVVYWPLQGFARGLVDEVAADPDGLVDLVPVDHVVDVLAHAVFDAEAEGVLHAVSGPQALRVAELVEHAGRLLDRPCPRLVPVGPHHADTPGAVFIPYFDVEVAFDGRRALALTGRCAAEPAAFLPAILDYALATRWGKCPLTRQAAHERRPSLTTQQETRC